LLLGLDTLGDHAVAAALSQRDASADHLLGPAVDPETLNEVRGDLQPVERQAEQLRHARLTLAEIVDHQMCASIA